MQNFLALGAPPPDPQISPPIANVWLRACPVLFNCSVIEANKLNLPTSLLAYFRLFNVFTSQDIFPTYAL